MHVSTLQPTLGHLDPKPTSKSNMLRGRNSATSADEQPHIGNYRLLKTIGKGNFAKVKLARHILTGKEVSSGGGAGHTSQLLAPSRKRWHHCRSHLLVCQVEVLRGMGHRRGGNIEEEGEES